MSKFQTILRVLVLLSVMVAAWGLALNQIVLFIEGNSLQNAESACASFNAPHAIITPDGIFCYKIINGSEQMIPLSALQEYYEQDSADSQ